VLDGTNSPVHRPSRTWAPTSQRDTGASAAHDVSPQGCPAPAQARQLLWHLSSAERWRRCQETRCSRYSLPCDAGWQLRHTPHGHAWERHAASGVSCLQQLVGVGKCCAHLTLPLEKSLKAVVTAFVALQGLLDVEHGVLQHLHIHALADCASMLDLARCGCHFVALFASSREPLCCHC
jgi:hypothetical protein